MPSASLLSSSSSSSSSMLLLLLLLQGLHLLLLHTTPAAAQDVISIGGFVSVSPRLAGALTAQGPHSSPDLAAVRIQLFSTGGVKVAEGDCSPNGYYFVPVDTSGSYTVRVHGPQGWVFEPQQLSVVCDASSCNKGEDVNFAVTGVELSGHLQAGPVGRSCKANTPPSFAGVTISAQPAASGGAGRKARPLSTTASDVGTYSIGPLLPGDYSITASHPNWQLEPDSMTHKLSLDSPQLTAPFRIMGYTLSGSVTSKSGPVAGIQVTLLSSDDGVTVGCSATNPPGHVSLPDIEAALSTTALCSVTTDARGRYSFTGVPCGQYSLQAAHPDTDSAFEIQPPSLSVSVGQGDATAPEEFVVTGFSVSGRVVDAAGNGVPSVSVFVNAKERATTDLTGRYVLARMQEGKTDVSAEKVNYEFSSLSAVAITPSAQVLPDIIVTKAGVCGRLTYGDVHFKRNSKRITLTSLDGSSGQQVNMQVQADDFNKFCFIVPPGRYRVAPYVSADDKSKGLVVAPTHTDLVVVGEPVLDLSFGQAKLSIHGSVYCVDGPCPDDVLVVVHVASTGTKVLSGKLVDLAAHAAAAGKPAITPDGGRTFAFTRVRPGGYLISAEREGWCWEGSRLPFKVEGGDATAPDLRQKGYELQVTTNQAVDLVVLGAEGSTTTSIQPFEVSAAKGKSTLCLPGSGSYVLSPRGCYIFSSKSYSISVGGPSTTSTPPPTLQLTASRAYVDGLIRVAASPGKVAASPHTSGIEIGTISVDDSAAEAGVVAKATALNPETEPGLYSYTLALDLGSTVMIEPVQPDGGSLIFKPSRTRYQLLQGAKGCPEAVPEITAYEGVVVTGSTEPAVAGADVKVIYATPSALSGKAAGDAAAQGVTKSDGTFAVGPLPSDASYSVEVSKAGHVLTLQEGGEAGGLTFSSKQLAQVTVSVDLPGGTDPSGVFLSLSGSAGFKQNTRLGSDKTITFQGLQPGTYYLKPLLREHSFEPPVADLTLDDGQQMQLTLRAVRTAWGISGAVTSVGGAPLAGAVVEACRGDSGVVLDSALTDEGGVYRVGNLKPGNSYLMRVRLDGRVLSAHPAGKKVTLGDSDASGVDFTAFRTSARSSLTAAVPPEVPAHLRASIKAELLPATASGSAVPSSSPVGTAAVDGSGFFELRGVKQGSYVLRLSCAAPAAGLSCDPLTVPVQVASKDVHLGVLPFRPSAVTAAGAGAPAPAGATSTSASTAAAGSGLAGSGEPISQEGLDWKLPVIVLVLLIAASATVLQPVVVDILQLRPLPPLSSAETAATYATTITSASSSFKAAGGGNGGGGGGGGSQSGFVSAVSRAAVAAAAAVPVPDAAGEAVASEWASDGELRSLGVKKGGASMRSRASRRA